MSLLEAQMREAAKNFEFERAASLRDKIRSLKQRDLGVISETQLPLLKTVAEAKNSEGCGGAGSGANCRDGVFEAGARKKEVEEVEEVKEKGSRSFVRDPNRIAKSRERKALTRLTFMSRLKPRPTKIESERYPLSRRKPFRSLGMTTIDGEARGHIRGGIGTRREIPRLAEQLATLAGSRKRSLRDDTVKFYRRGAYTTPRLSSSRG